MSILIQKMHKESISYWSTRAKLVFAVLSVSVLTVLLKVFLIVIVIPDNSTESNKLKDINQRTELPYSNRTIKIKITDFCFKDPTNENPKCFIYDHLKDTYDIVYSEEPDFLFYSVYRQNHIKYTNCVKIFYAGENIMPDFNKCDYGISYNYIYFGDRH